MSGQFQSGINVAVDYKTFAGWSRTDPRYHVQIEFSVTNDTQIWTQLLLDCSIKNQKYQFLKFNLFEIPEDIQSNGTKISKRIFKRDISKKHRVS